MEDRDIDLSDQPEVEVEAFGRALVRKGLKPVHPIPIARIAALVGES